MSVAKVTVWKCIRKSNRVEMYENNKGNHVEMYENNKSNRVETYPGITHIVPWCATCTALQSAN